jgi:hypothetical protein
VLPLPSGVEPIKNTFDTSVHYADVADTKLTMNTSNVAIKLLMLLSVFVLHIGGKKLNGVHFRFPAVVVSKF